MNYKTLLSLTLLLGIASCTEDNPAYNPDPFLPDECRVGVEITETFEAYERPDLLDILIVIDDSGDVEDLQSALADALPGFLAPLAESAHIELAVATTNGLSPQIAPPGTEGEGCGSNSHKFANSSDENWTKVAACNVQQGSDGDAYQQALGVVEALVVNTPSDLGFFRPNARRVILVVSNEDDCSHGEEFSVTDQPRQACIDNASALTSVKSVTDQLLALPTTPEGLVLAVISGPPTEASPDNLRPVCSSSIGSSYSANRLAKATSEFGDQGWFSSLCVDSLDASLTQLRRGLAKSVSLCPARLLAHEPLAVSGNDEDGEFAIRLGSDGFVFSGITPTCEHGELVLAASPASKADSISVTYCVVEE